MIQIYMPTTVVGVEFNDKGFVIRAAPVVKYMIGWSRSRVVEYCAKRNWKWKALYAD